MASEHLHNCAADAAPYALFALLQWVHDGADPPDVAVGNMMAHFAAFNATSPRLLSLAMKCKDRVADPGGPATGLVLLTAWMLQRPPPFEGVKLQDGWSFSSTPDNGDQPVVGTDGYHVSATRCASLSQRWDRYSVSLVAFCEYTNSFLTFGTGAVEGSPSAPRFGRATRTPRPSPTLAATAFAWASDAYTTVPFALPATAMMTTAPVRIATNPVNGHIYALDAAGLVQELSRDGSDLFRTVQLSGFEGAAGPSAIAPLTMISSQRFTSAAGFLYVMSPRGVLWAVSLGKLRQDRVVHTASLGQGSAPIGFVVHPHAGEVVVAFRDGALAVLPADPATTSHRFIDVVRRSADFTGVQLGLFNDSPPQLGTVVLTVESPSRRICFDTVALR